MSFTHTTLVQLNNTEDIAKVTANFNAEVAVEKQAVLRVNEIDIPEIEELLGYGLD